MSLGAMMAGGRAFRNQVNLIATTSWVVPSGVTSVMVLAQAKGGDAGPNIVQNGGQGGGGGGGGGAILYVPLTVTPGDTLITTSGTNFIFPVASTYYETTAGNGSGPALFRVDEGAPGYAIDSRGGAGGDAWWYQGGTFHALQSNGGAGGGGAGGAGAQVTVSTGLIVSGGGGGGGNTVSPAAAGGNGGAAGSGSGGLVASSYWGGGGGGVLSSGSGRFGAGVADVTGTTPTFIWLLWN